MLLVTLALVPMVVLGQVAPAFARGAVRLLFPALIAAGSAVEPPRALRTVCLFLGAVSYPVYAINFPVMFAVSGIAARSHLPVAATVAVYLLALLGLAAALARFWDAPLRRVVTRRLHLWRSARLQAL